jgi:DNA-binding IclR family transcriptional regulator
MSNMAILRELKRGPLTNAQLAEATAEHSGSVARDCAKLIQSGRVVRADAARGRGTKATYALAPAATETAKGPRT